MDPLATFLLLLIRDDLPLGTVERLVAYVAELRRSGKPLPPQRHPRLAELARVLAEELRGDGEAREFEALDDALTERIGIP